MPGLALAITQLTVSHAKFLLPVPMECFRACPARCRYAPSIRVISHVTRLLTSILHDRLSFRLFHSMRTRTL